LAITLVIATNQAFKGKRKDEVTIHDTIHDTIQVTAQVSNQVSDQVPTKYRPSTDQVDPVIIEKIVEVPVYVEKGGLPIDEYFGKEDLIELQKIEIDEVVEPQIEQESNVQEEPKRLSYSNRNGKSLRFNRF
jgi:hypothetical protein